MKKMLMVLLAMVVLGGCAPTSHYSPNPQKTFKVGEIISVPAGATLFRHDRCADAWVTYPSNPDEKKYLTIDCYFGRELIYSGRAGNIINLTYREYSGNWKWNPERGQGYIRDSFTQMMTYDLSTSKSIVFQNYKIEIIEADNFKITFKITSYGEYK